LRLEEALDVLGSLGHIATGCLATADTIALSLRTGRVNRKLNRFDEAEVAYATAAVVAGADTNAGLLSRIGRAECIRGRGNLQLAEASLHPILKDARARGDRDAESRVEHVLGVVLHHMGQSADGIPHVWKAFELYEEIDSRLRALNDLGVMMLTLGDAVGAERALKEVVRRDGMRDNVANATIELMHCASFRRDRVGFERYRAKCEQMKTDLPPNILADYYLKAGIGEARFGRFRRAAATMTRALKVAEDAGLHSFVFKIERIRNGLGACEQALEAPSAESNPVFDNEALREVSASLAQLVGQPA
jgi:tetratricopeptide (TPR) repeat protein